MSDDAGALLARAARLRLSDLVDRCAAPRVLTGLVRLGGTGTMAGWARTARAVPDDAAGVHAAVAACGPGDVVVVDYGGDGSVAGVGALVAAEATRRGAAGMVLWGRGRDASALRALGLPVFATGLHPIAGGHHDPGEADVELEIGGLRVAPGELVVADDDGLGVFAPEGLESLLTAAEETANMDRGLAAGVAAGMPLSELSELHAYLDAVDD